jgi:hypothetical protein
MKIVLEVPDFDKEWIESGTVAVDPSKREGLAFTMRKMSLWGKIYKSGVIDQIEQKIIARNKGK